MVYQAWSRRHHTCVNISVKAYSPPKTIPLLLNYNIFCAQDDLLCVPPSTECPKYVNSNKIKFNIRYINKPPNVPKAQSAGLLGL